MNLNFKQICLVFILSLSYIPNNEFLGSRSILASASDQSPASTSPTKTSDNIRFNRLSKHVKHFETLNYDNIRNHKRAKRDLENHRQSMNSAKPAHDHHPISQTNVNPHSNERLKHPIRINFKAHNRDFNLRLRPDIKSVFADGFIIEDSHGNSIRDHIDHDLFSLTGYLHGYPKSLVIGSLKKGIFEGKIYTHDNEVFYVEKARRYLDDLKEHNPKFSNLSQFHSVIYSSEHVQHPHDSTDGHEQIEGWLNQISQSAIPGSEVEYQDRTREPKSQRDLYYERMSKMFEYSDDGTHFNLSRPIESCDNLSSRAVSQNCTHASHGNRAKRDTDYLYREPAKRISSNIPRQKRACTLFIQTDTYLWNNTRRLHDNDLDTREDIASLVAQHIKAVNHIYENSDFGGIRGLKFIVQRLKINDTSACSGNRREHNPFCQPNIDVSNFLNLNSQFNHNDFCLAYIFTYRDFTGGTLGLAWVASTNGASGGICEKYKQYTENLLGRQVHTKRSLNTGIITFVNYNSRVPPKVSELTLAHEIGHNFGSPHDYPPECRPGGAQGNYIMYSSATSGERSNNNKFSGCSIRNISQVLHAVFSSDDKLNCFEEDNGPFCGNKIVEEGEMCDCGYNAQECTEQCCVPRETSGDLYGGATSCQRVLGKECSPSEGPCCGNDCSFVGSEKICRLETECSHLQTCDSRQSSCLPSKAKPDMTQCNNGTQVCIQGKCSGSICIKYNMEECFLSSKNGARPDEMCELACQQKDKPSTCKRTSDIPEMKHMSGWKLRPGSPCDEFIGYCDVFQICRKVDTDGPLARLKNSFFNQRTLTSIKQWLITHWWVCALAVIAFMMVMYVFIQCCAVHTPTSNPHKRPALRISETIRHPTQTLRRKRRSYYSSSGMSHPSQSSSSSNGLRNHHRRHRHHTRPHRSRVSGGSVVTIDFK